MEGGCPHPPPRNGAFCMLRRACLSTSRLRSAPIRGWASVAVEGTRPPSLNLMQLAERLADDHALDRLAKQRRDPSDALASSIEECVSSGVRRPQVVHVHIAYGASRAPRNSVPVGGHLRDLAGDASAVLSVDGTSNCAVIADSMPACRLLSSSSAACRSLTRTWVSAATSARAMASIS